MSNQIVGPTYAQVIEKVIQTSLNDFEEHGVDQQTLQEMKETWQERLSKANIAIFPWDPAPPAPANPPTVPSNVPKTEPSPAPAAASAQHQQGYVDQRVKTESPYEAPNSGYPMQNGYPAVSGLDRNIAQQRAAQLLQRNYGQQAEASLASAGITHPPNGLQLPGQAPRPTGLQLPGQQQQQQQQQQPPRPVQPQMPPQQHPSNLYKSQNDGAGDAEDEWRAVVQARREQSDEGRCEADRMLYAELQRVARQQDSGLMVPLKEVKTAKSKKRRSPAHQSEPSAPETSSAVPIPQLDGEFDDDDVKAKIDDDEAINSDLDDSEDELAQDEEEEDGEGGAQEIMLCTYDKVQRVKNKWKCTLKDGILNTNGKDYLFHKANGEFEW